MKRKSFRIEDINIGSRQNGRLIHPSIINCECDSIEILQSIDQTENMQLPKSTLAFGDGKSVERFLKIINKPEIWKTSKQKVFNDNDTLHPR